MPIPYITFVYCGWYFPVAYTCACVRGCVCVCCLRIRVCVYRSAAYARYFANRGMANILRSRSSRLTNTNYTHTHKPHKINAYAYVTNHTHAHTHEYVHTNTHTHLFGSSTVFLVPTFGTGFPFGGLGIEHMPSCVVHACRQADISTRYKQGKNKIQTRYNQGINTIQTRYKHDTNTIQTRYKDDTNKAQTRHKQGTRPHKQTVNRVISSDSSSRPANCFNLYLDDSSR